MSFEYQTVKLVAITQPTIANSNFQTDDPEDWGCTCNKLTAEEFIAYAARVSNPGNQMNTATADRLIKYLIKNSHWSPFEMVSATIEIKTTRDIGRQILRHRSFSFQEFSQRYAKVEDVVKVIRECRLQDLTNRQKSIRIERYEGDPVPTALANVIYQWEQAQTLGWTEASERYEQMIKIGIAKEQARALLPEGLTPTTMYMSGTLRSFIHWLQIRSDPNTTQLEHVDIANKAVAALRPHFPNIFKALEQ